VLGYGNFDLLFSSEESIAEKKLLFPAALWEEIEAWGRRGSMKEAIVHVQEVLPEQAARFNPLFS
jgi:hypothetical protein